MNAIEALGHSKPDDDWELKPDLHADFLPLEADSLASILRGSKVASIIRKYDDADKKAISAQQSYKNLSKRGVITASGAALIGAIFLFLKSVDDVNSYTYHFIERYKVWFLLLECLAIALSALFSYLIKHNKFFDKWMDYRARAESARIMLFEYVCGVEHSDVSGGIPLLQLQLEYFRRYQLDVQLLYYKGRGQQHEQAANRIVNRGGVITFLIVLIGAVSGVYNSAEVVSALALLGITIPVILTAHNNLTLISQDERNAKRYLNTYDHLLEISGELDHVRKKVAMGDRNSMLEFMKMVNEEISVEHREWISLQKKSEKPKIEVNEYKGK